MEKFKVGDYVSLAEGMQHWEFREGEVTWVSEDGEAVYVKTDGCLRFEFPREALSLMKKPEQKDKVASTWDEKTRGPQMASPSGMTIYKYPIDSSIVELSEEYKIIRVETDPETKQSWLWAIVDSDSPDNYPVSIRKVDIPVLEEFTVSMNYDDEIISIEHVNGFTSMWIDGVVSDDETNREDVKFRAFKTGAKMPDDILVTMKYVGFYPLFIQMELGLYVFRDYSK